MNILSIASEELSAAKATLTALYNAANNDAEWLRRGQQLENLKRVKFQLNGRMTRAAGIAIISGPNFGMIKLSRKIFSDPRNAEGIEAELRNTIRHEIAHIAEPTDRKHGRAWKIAAKELSCTAEQYHEMAVTGKRRFDFQISCPRCDRNLGTLRNRVTVSRWMGNRLTNCCHVRPRATKV